MSRPHADDPGVAPKPMLAAGLRHRRTPLRDVCLAIALSSTTGRAFAQSSPAAANGVSSPAPVAASDSPPPRSTSLPASAQRLTLAEVVVRARRDPPSVLLAAAHAQAASAQIAIARSALLPQVTGTFGNTSQTSSGPTIVALLIPGVPTDITSTSYTLDATLNARWTVWDFGRTSLNIDAARLQARGSDLDVRSAERAAISEAASAFFVVLADQELIASNEETVRQREHELEITTGLVNAGGRPPIEQLRAQMTLANAQLDVTASQAAEQNDASALAAAVALDPALPVDVIRPGEIVVDDDPVRAADAAVASRPEIAAARARIAASETQIRAVRALYRPSLYVSGTGTVGFVQYTDPSPAGGLHDSLSASTGISVPVFDPSIPPQIHSAESTLAIARAALEQQVLAARSEAAQAAIQVRTARQTLQQAEHVASISAANLEQAEGRYSMGAAPLLELVDAQGADATARIAVVRARFQVELAKVRLLTAIGQLQQLDAQR